MVEYISPDEVLRQREEQIMAAQQAEQAGAFPYSPAMINPKSKQNIVEWELSFEDEIEQISHLIRSDIYSRTEDGTFEWMTNPNPEERVFNQRGVNDIMREIVSFVNKNKVLSHYKLDEIKPRVALFGHELRAFVYSNYQFYGIDNEYKENNFSIIVWSIIDIVEAAYRRALNGEAHKGLNEARTLNQNEPIMPNQSFNFPQQAQPKKGVLSKLLPWNWK